MGKQTIIPFGPQHPVLPEPIHLDLVCEDEKVVDVIPKIGFIHRGLEKLIEKKEFTDFVHIADRVCGICSFIHGMTYCMAIEGVMNIEVPPRAQYLRVIWSEFSRIHSHLLWLGLTADAFGFENLFMATWRIREHILDIIEETTGGRVIFGASKIGGTRRDISNDKLKDILKELEGIEAQIRECSEVFLKDSSVKSRLVGVGVLTKEDAYKLGAVGPMLRASGHDYDVRMSPYAAYQELDFVPVVENSCDSYGRCVVRIKELYQSCRLIEKAVAKIPEGAIETKIVGFPKGEYFARSEQPRGEVVYYVKGDGTKMLKRFRVRTPTFANLPPLLKVLTGCQLADVPILVLTIDPCISCTER
ncbi:MAG: nickel-dependent hydrogenase large subunit [Candidatus Omnitrophica bacterium]|nr:nickel-dependent hydrogenase large subunit [Candidatus Omnitrophota bacterium]